MQDGSLSPLRAFFKNKWVRIILIIDAIALLIVIGLAIWNATKVSTITFNIAPIDATISVNGNTNYTNGQYAITPGTYEVTISREGLESKTLTVDLTPKHVTTVSAFLVGADNSFNFYELKENYESYKKLESIASKENNITTDSDTSAEEFVGNYQRNLRLYQTALPIDYSDQQEIIRAGSPWYTTTRAFTISYNHSDECTKTLCIKISIEKIDDDNFIQEYLKEKGFDIKLYEVKYETHFSQN